MPIISSNINHGHCADWQRIWPVLKTGCVSTYLSWLPSHCPMERSCSSRQYWWWLSGQLIRLDCALLSIISCVAQSLLNTIKLWGILRRSDSPRHRSIPLQYACLPMMGNLGVTVTLSDSIESRWERGKESVCVCQVKSNFIGHIHIIAGVVKCLCS